MTDEVCIGVDVGGTFTDAVLTLSGRNVRAKALTTVGDLRSSVLSACERAAERAGFTLDDILPSVKRFGLGTTAVTNVLASGTGRHVGLITTKGFEDLIPLSRGRWESEDGWLVQPRQIVDRRRILGVNERIDRDGDVVTPLDVADVVAAAHHLIETEDVEAIALSYLWSFKNPIHEELSLSALREELGDFPVTSGAALLPVMREYERTMFALLNAYTGAALGGIDNLVEVLSKRGLKVPVLLVHSGGGSITVDEARESPISLAESGPAAGVTAATAVAQSVGIEHALTCDMGGTTFDVSVIRGGQPLRKVRGQVMGIWTALSSLDIESLGAGGGSIARLDALGMLSVGPASAGSNPGPACYGRGGAEATVTDAMLVLGYLSGDRFLGGDMKLDREAALAVCESLGSRFGSSALETAWGIREIALTGMVSAVRGRLAEFGLEGPAHSIVSYGGSSGLFTGAIAEQIGSPMVAVPHAAAVLSAFGAATADLRRERSRTVGLAMPADRGPLAAVAKGLRQAVEADLDRDGISRADREVRFEADLRFRRQKWEIVIPFTDIDDLVNSDGVVEAFKKEYIERYGVGALMAGAPVELAVLRAIGIGFVPHGTLGRHDVEPVAPGTPAPKHADRILTLERDAPPSPVTGIDWTDLAPGHRIVGPALIDGTDTTVWVPERAIVDVDSGGSLLMRITP
jgi:N-methylhydantoinase A